MTKASWLDEMDEMVKKMTYEVVMTPLKYGRLSPRCTKQLLLSSYFLFHEADINGAIKKMKDMHEYADDGERIRPRFGFFKLDQFESGQGDEHARNAVLLRRGLHVLS